MMLEAKQEEIATSLNQLQLQIARRKQELEHLLAQEQQHMGALFLLRDLLQAVGGKPDEAAVELSEGG
jgi:hypothetical protein